MNTIQQFRYIAIAEGISFLVLLFIAMPLKYVFDQPLAVKYTGWIHGILFVIYLYSLISVWMQFKWHINKVMLALLAAVLPFGTFYFEKKYLHHNI
jgi:integral membrane protein